MEDPFYVLLFAPFGNALSTTLVDPSVPSISLRFDASWFSL